MRILHLNHGYGGGGGAETYLRRLARLQRDHGDVVAVLAAEGASPVEPDQGIELQRIEPRAKLRFAQIGLGSLRRRIDALRPDVIHLHNVLRLLNPWALDELRRIAPLVWSLHDLELIAPLEQPSPPGYGWKLERWRGRARRTALVVPSEFLLRRIQPLRSANRIELLAPFGAPLHLGPPQEPATVLYLGGRRIEKGLHELLAALGLLQEWRVGFRAILVGDQIECAIPAYQQAALGDQLELNAPVDEDGLTLLLRRAAVVVFPSLLPESFGLAGFEGCCAGRPVVGYDSGAVREWLLPGENGYLVRAGDQRALAEALARCLHDPSAARALGEAGRRRVAERHRPEDHLEALRAIYAEAGRG